MIPVHAPEPDRMRRGGRRRPRHRGRTGPRHAPGPIPRNWFR